MTQPNVLFIMTDQQRWDAMSCSGDWVKNPNLDRIAAEGVRFSRCVTTTPICVPARVSLATGRYPHNTAVWHNLAYTLSPEAPTWMQAVRDAGYRTSLFGKTHLHPHQGDLRECEHPINAYGLDDVDEIGGPRASAVVYQVSIACRFCVVDPRRSSLVPRCESNLMICSRVAAGAMTSSKLAWLSTVA